MPEEQLTLYSYYFLFQCCKAIFQIRDDVIDMLGTDGQTDGALLDALIQQFLFGKLGMSRGCRMDHQALHICHICQQGEDL